MVLRKRFKGGYQANFWLGNQYHYIDREACQDEFKVTAKQEFGDNWETSELAKECFRPTPCSFSLLSISLHCAISAFNASCLVA